MRLIIPKKAFYNDTEIIKGILEIFIEETPKDYDSLTLAVKEKKGNDVKQMAHKL